MLTFEGLVEGRIVRRYQRFLADVTLEDGSLVTVHTTNTGTMTSCWAPGDPVLLQPAMRPGRKLPYTWLACCHEGHWIGVETGIPNKVVAEAARTGALPGLGDLAEVRTEVRYGRERSRIDVHARDGQGRDVYIEVKNTTLRIGDRICFPDAVTERGQKHLRELQGMVEEGHRAVICFFVNRPDGATFDAARDIDPAYAWGLDQAAAAGVEVLPLLAPPRRLDATTLQWAPEGVLPWVRSL